MRRPDASAPKNLPRVLVVDDDDVILTLITTTLEDEYFVKVCQTAETAMVEAHGKKPFDVVIIDFMLPGMSGLELIERLRSHPKTKTVPILMLTGHVKYQLEPRARAAGANAFIYKPFTATLLKTSVAKLLVSSRA